MPHLNAALFTINSLTVMTCLPDNSLSATSQSCHASNFVRGLSYAGEAHGLLAFEVYWWPYLLYPFPTREPLMNLASLDREDIAAAVLMKGGFYELCGAAPRTRPAATRCRSRHAGEGPSVSGPIGLHRQCPPGQVGSAP